MFTELGRRILMLLRRKQFDADLDEEMRLHRELREQEQIEQGLSPKEAHYAAQKRFGNDLVLREQNRDMWGWNWPEHVLQDIRYGSRMLTKNPGFTAMAVITLALGIGANTAVFSVVNAVLLRRLPYRDSDRLVWITDYVPSQNSTVVFDSDFVAWNRQSHAFEGMAAYTTVAFNLTGAGEPERLAGGRVTANFFSVLGVQPVAGRGFLPEEDRQGAPTVVVLSHALWQRRFGASWSVIGKAITLDGNSYTVVGVMPASFEFLENNKADLFVPFVLSDQPVSLGRSVMTVDVVARLKPGLTIERAQADLAVINRRLQAAYPGGFAKMMAGAQARVVPLHDRLVGDARPALFVLLGAVGFVLLIVCANVANLQLSRAVARQKEMAVRAALGASRLLLARQLLTECVQLAALGGAAGLVLAFWGTDLLRRVGPPSIPHLMDTRIDVRVLVFTAVIVLLTGTLFGLTPVFAASKVDPNQSLKEGGVQVTQAPVRHRLRGTLMVSELALALALLAGAGLLIRTFVRLTRIDPGFDPHNVLTAHISLPVNRYRDEGRRRAFMHDLLERVRAIPKVSSAGITGVAPLMGLMESSDMEVEGRPSPPQGRSVAIDTVSPGYFRTMGIPLLSGRFFTESDTAGAPKVAIINQLCARRYFPGESPIGQHIRPGSEGKDWSAVVGVVGDVRQLGLLSLPQPEIFLPSLQAPDFWMALAIRTASEPLSLAPALRSQVEAIDGDLPVFEITTMEQYLSEQIASQRFAMLLLGIFAFLALLLSGVGIYGVVAYSVAQRTHEIGVRIALGAGQGEVLKLVVGQGLRLAVAGVALGLAGALGLTRFLSSLLYDVRPTDPLTFVAISVLLSGVALLASYVPARRATKVDPMVALRYE